MTHFLKGAAVVLALVFFVQCSGDKKPAAQNQGKTKNGKADARLTELNAKLVADPNNGSLYQERANYFLEKKIYNKALDDIGRALSIDSLNPDFLYTKGDIYYSMLRFDDATAALAKCLQQAKDHAQGNVKMAQILIHLKQYKDALKHIDAALKKDVNLAEGYFLKGVIFQFTGDTTNALSSYQTAVEQKAGYYDAYIALGLIYASRKDTMAIEYYNSALSLQPTSNEALYNLAIFLQDMGYYNRAFAVYNRLIKLGPNEGAHHNKGYIYMNYLGKMDKAVEQFDSALKINPGYVEAWHNRGAAYRELKKYKEARADFEMALKLNPQFDLSAEALDDMDRKKQK